MAKMRTIKEAYIELKQADEHTAVTQTGLRRLVNEGKIPSVKVGNKTLVDMDNVYMFLEMGTASKAAQPEAGKIRPIRRYMDGAYMKRIVNN